MRKSTATTSKLAYLDNYREQMNDILLLTQHCAGKRSLEQAWAIVYLRMHGRHIASTFVTTCIPYYLNG